MSRDEESQKPPENPFNLVEKVNGMLDEWESMFDDAKKRGMSEDHCKSVSKFPSSTFEHYPLSFPLAGKAGVGCCTPSQPCPSHVVDSACHSLSHYLFNTIADRLNTRTVFPLRPWGPIPRSDPRETTRSWRSLWERVSRGMEYSFFAPEM